MALLSGVVGLLMIAQTVSWLAGCAGARVTIMAPKPLPPDEIKAPSTAIGINQFDGGAAHRPRPLKAPDKSNK
jgi:hypothetical protein